MHIQQHQLRRLAPGRACSSAVVRRPPEARRSPSVAARPRGGAGGAVVFDHPGAWLPCSGASSERAARWWGQMGLRCGRVAQRHAHPEHAAAPQLRAQADLMPQQAAQAFDDGQARPAPRSSARPSSRRRNSSKISRCSASGMPGPWSCTSDAQVVARPAAAHHDAPARL